MSPHQAAFAAQRAKLLFGCYRRGDANDPETYVSAIAAVLARYSTEIIREVTDPNTGIQTTEKYMTFMPNAGELKVYCEGIAARKERLQRLGSLPAPDFNRARLPAPEPRPGDQATVFVPANNPRYPEFLAWSKREDTDPRLFKFDARPGIWIAFGVWDQRHISTKRLSDYTKPIVGQTIANGTREPIPAEETTMTNGKPGDDDSKFGGDSVPGTMDPGPQPKPEPAQQPAPDDESKKGSG